MIVSKNCGVVELVKSGLNGYVIDPDNSQHIKETILEIDDNKYQALLSGVNNFSINVKDDMQIQAYL